MQAGDGLIRVLEREISTIDALLRVFTGVGGAGAVPPLLGDGLDDTAVPEVVRPRVVDGAERISSTRLLLADGMRVTPRLARRGLRRSHQLGSALALLLLPSRGRTFLGVRRLGFLGVEVA